MLCCCSTHEHGSALARPVTVRSAGAVPSTIAAMMRGETKASGAIGPISLDTPHHLIHRAAMAVHGMML